MGVSAAPFNRLQNGYCTATTTVNNSNTYVDVPGMSFSVVANGIYIVFVRLAFNASAAGDIKFTWDVPAGGALKIMLANLNDDRSAENTIYTASGASAVTATSGADKGAEYTAYYIGGANAGTVKLQFAQNIADASDCSVLVNQTMLYALKVN